MTLFLHTIKPSAAAKKKKKKKQVGRGGKRGTYSGRGGKGQRARSGGKSGSKRRGMRQMETTHKLRGFKSKKKKPEIINLADFDGKFKSGDKITNVVLLRKGLVDRTKNGVKILGNGEINIKLEISGCMVSRAAKEKIEKAGGKVN